MPSLNWIGKDKVVSHHLEVPYRVLEPRFSVGGHGSENKIIHGDNLEALKSLLPRYAGRIDCIYIDPPYNTGNEGWVYNDRVNHPQIRRWLGEVVGKGSEDLSRHDKWLCMMYPRLRLLHSLLSRDGVIFISIDDNEQASLRLICDEIFGRNNFVANIIWQRAYAPVNLKKTFSTNHDFIICYAKNIENIEFSLPRTEEQDKIYKNPDNDPRGIWTSGDISVGPAIDKKIYPITTPSGRVVHPPAGACWRVSKGRFEELKADGRIWFGKDGGNVPRIKRFISEVKDGVTPLTVWTYGEVGHTQDAKREVKELFPESSTPFETPKSLRLLERIFQIATKPNSIVLDSFAGSGTTAHALLNLNKQDGGNRKFILVEMEDYAKSITAERVKRVIEGYGEGKNASPPTGGDFVFYQLGEPLFQENKMLNENLPCEKIMEYIYYSETKQSYKKSDEPYFLGQKEGACYYFYYKKGAETVLDGAFLKSIKNRGKPTVIYADLCLLEVDQLKELGVIFKKIPREIARF